MTRGRPVIEPSRERQRRNRRGAAAEAIAAVYLMAHGHRILARRFKTPLGEIDLITRKGRRIGFVEVKLRRTRLDCEAAITARLGQRVRRAAGLWQAKQEVFRDFDIGFDLVFIVPWHRPLYLPDAL